MRLTREEQRALDAMPVGRAQTMPTTMTTEVVERKPSGLALYRFPCGCLQWFRRSGAPGRRVTSCCGGYHDGARWGALQVQP